MKAQSAKSRIAAFLGKYDPAIAAQLRDARQRLRKHFRRGYELVFDNYNALVFGFSPSESSTDSFVSIAGYPRWVTLFFLDGASLSDPRGLLEGAGKRVRSIRLEDPGDIDSAAVRALILQAIRPRKTALLAAPKLTTIIKTTVVRQRARRPSPV